RPADIDFNPFPDRAWWRNQRCSGTAEPAGRSPGRAATLDDHRSGRSGAAAEFEIREDGASADRAETRRVCQRDLAPGGDVAARARCAATPAILAVCRRPQPERARVPAEGQI